MSQCVSTLPLPAYFPAALSLAIAAVSALIIFIAYCIRERKLRKTFYGITDEMEEDEKQQEEAEALGRFDGEVKVIQSMEKLGPHSIAPTPGSQVKVMMKRRRPAGSTKPPTTSREMLCSTSALTPHLHHSSVSPQIECEFKFSIEANQNGFATQIIESLKSLIIEEVYRARTANPHQKQLLSEDETRIGEFIVSEMRAKLESLTNNNPWICHGRLINNTNWVVNGHENLLCSHTNMILSVKITIEQPISIVLLGYSLKHMGSSGSCITPVPLLPTPSKDKLHPSAQIDSTPHPTDPMTPSKHSKASQSSALKRIKTAEPINNPARTQVVTVVPAAVTTTNGTAVLSPGRPGTTVLVAPKKSESKKPIGQTPKPPPTPRRTPPKQIIATPTIAPTPTPALKTTITATPKAHTPVLVKTITGISHTPTPVTTTAGTVIPTPTPPMITVSKTPNATKHGKKTRSDDTQLSGEHAK